MEWWGAAAFVAVIAIVALFATQGNTPTGAITQCSDVKSDNLRSECFSRLGIIRLDLDICDESEKSKYFCYEQVAQGKEDSSICEIIDDNYWQPICYKNIGILTNDFRVCDDVDILRLANDCHFAVATNTSTEETCRNILDDWKLFYQCFTKIAVDTENVEVCMGLADDLNRDKCILQVAKANGDSELCELTHFQAIKEICIERTT